MFKHLESGRYRIVNARDSGIMCPDLVERSPNNAEDQKVQSWREHLDHEHFSKAHGDVWTVDNDGDGHYLLHNPSTERYMTVEDKENEPRPWVMLTKSDGQLWTLKQFGGYFLIRPNGRPDRAVAPRDNANDPDAHLRLLDSLPGADRGWYFIRA